LIEQLFSGYPIDIEGMMLRLRKTAVDLGLPFGERRKTYNSRLAQELGLWAESKNKGYVFHKAAFKAYFVHGKNIAKIPVLVDLAASIGLSSKEAAAVLESRAFKNLVDADWDLSREKEITAVPTFVMNHDKLVGAQPYEVLTKFVVTNGVKKKQRLMGDPF
jgi:predicted DsbA family dithiol-disulfide isomerase